VRSPENLPNMAPSSIIICQRFVLGKETTGQVGNHVLRFTYLDA
jgi:hypothetical protein